MHGTYNVYGHRPADGFAFASIGDEAELLFELPHQGEQSGIEYVESKMFGALGDEVFGPSPSEADCTKKQKELDSPIPLESERTVTLYKVGTVTVERNGNIDVNIVDNADEITEVGI